MAFGMFWTYRSTEGIDQEKACLIANRVKTYTPSCIGQTFTGDEIPYIKGGHEEPALPQAHRVQQKVHQRSAVKKILWKCARHALAYESTNLEF